MRPRGIRSLCAQSDVRPFSHRMLRLVDVRLHRPIVAITMALKGASPVDAADTIDEATDGPLGSVGTDLSRPAYIWLGKVCTICSISRRGRQGDGIEGLLLPQAYAGVTCSYFR